MLLLYNQYFQSSSVFTIIIPLIIFHFTWIIVKTNFIESNSTRLFSSNPLHYLHTPRLDPLPSASSPFPLNSAPFTFIYPYTYIIHIFLHPYTNIPLFPYHSSPFQSSIWHLILYLASSTLYLASGICHPLWYLASSILYLASGILSGLWQLA